MTSTPLDELTAALCQLRLDAGQPSLRGIEQRIAKSDMPPASHTTVGMAFKGHHLPSWETVESIVRVLHGDLNKFKGLWQSAKTSRAQEPAAHREPHLTLHARTWSDYFVGKEDEILAALLAGHTPAWESLFIGLDAGSRISELASVEALFTDKSPNFGITVHTQTDSVDHPVNSLLEFWLLVQLDQVLAGKKDGDRRWLLAATARQLRRNPSADNVPELWTVFFRAFLDPARRGSNWLRTIANDAIKTSTRKRKKVGEAEDEVGKVDRNVLYTLFDLLLTVSCDQADAIHVLIGVLTDFEHSERCDGTPDLLEKIRLLLARGTACLADLKGTPLRFAPTLVRLADDPLFGYKFEIMKHPLTVSDHACLYPEPRPKVAELPLPYVFQRFGNDFGKVIDHALTIVDLANGAEIDDHFRWDIPNAVEWLAMAGCLDQPYPWGRTVPDKSSLLANLCFDRNVPRRRPVGIHRNGKSPSGAHDCCGGVHELVRIGLNTAPEDFRLAGGSYRSAPANAACNVLRPLQTGSQRANLGLRLVRYQRSDATARSRAFRRFINDQHLGTPARAWITIGKLHRRRQRRKPTDDDLFM